MEIIDTRVTGASGCLPSLIIQDRPGLEELLYPAALYGTIPHYREQEAALLVLRPLV